MSTITEGGLKTRLSLLCHLRNLEDRDRWRTFVDLYWRMLYNVARLSVRSPSPPLLSRPISVKLLA